MAFDLTHDILLPLIINTGALGLIAFLLKNWLTKAIDHSFNKQLEEYKSLLGKENIGYQIDKTEFSKKKYEHAKEIHEIVLERKRRNDAAYNLLNQASYHATRRFFNEDQEFINNMREKVTIASPFLDISIIQAIEEYQIISRFIVTDIITIAEHRASQDLAQLPFSFIKVMRPMTEIDIKSTNDELNAHSRRSFEVLDKINSGLRDYLAVK